MESLVDSFTNYPGLAGNDAFISPSVSPANLKTGPVLPDAALKRDVQPTSLLSASQQLSGPSHPYGLFKQQTGIVQGALASTFAVNQNNPEITGYTNYNGGFFDPFPTATAANSFDFQASLQPSNVPGIDIDMDFESPLGDNDYFGESSPGGPDQSATPMNQIGRLWPGMHTQAAMAKAQAERHQQGQQQQQLMQLQQQQPPQPQLTQPQQPDNRPKPPRSKAPRQLDPVAEQKITQILSTMRATPTIDTRATLPVLNIPRPKKDEEDMDPDERLLASEEGKKLDSKARRQLRNKVSARAFRSRRKEYISQLESELTTRVSETTTLRAHNQALGAENQRLTDFIRNLLAIPSLAAILDQITIPPMSQAPEHHQMPHDMKPFFLPHHASPQPPPQPMGLAMIPEQQPPMDFGHPTPDSMDKAQFQI